jgi:hypothetical protein
MSNYEVLNFCGSKFVIRHSTFSFSSTTNALLVRFQRAKTSARIPASIN